MLPDTTFLASLETLDGGNRSLLLLSVALHLLVYTAPLLRKQPKILMLALLEGLLVRWITSRRKSADLAEVILTPLIPLLTLPVFWRAWRSNVEWKGRHYAQGKSVHRQGQPF